MFLFLWKLCVFVWLLIGARGLLFVWLVVPPRARDETRLAIFADPQLEGGERVLKQGAYGAINNWLNDAMMTHVTRSMYWFADVSMVLTLGDLFSSQYISDDEFEDRVNRLNSIMDFGPNIDVVHVAGNHDLGYSSELTRRRVGRFERALGPVNAKRTLAGHTLLTVHAMALDDGQRSDPGQFHKNAWDWVEQHHAAGHGQQQQQQQPLILATHIPLHKPAGTCVDRPDIQRNRDGGIREQTMLSPESSQRLLTRLRPVLVLTGHDHEGCVYTHSVVPDDDTPSSSTSSAAASSSSSSAFTVTEHTMRALQGDYGSYAAVLSIRRAAGGQTPLFEYRVWKMSFCPKTIALVYWIVALPVLLLARLCGTYCMDWMNRLNKNRHVIATKLQ